MNKEFKKHLLLWIAMILLHVVCLGQAVKHVYPSFITYWNVKTLIPDSVIYTATPHKKVCDRLPSFHVVGNMPNEDRDYAKSGLDQGHLYNASDANGNKTDEYNSFGQDNIFPQTTQDNRITWLALENYIRALNIPVKVKIYWQGIAGYMGVDKVVIPAYCIKEIWYGSHHEKYIVPNTKTVNQHPFTYYKQK